MSWDFFLDTLLRHPKVTLLLSGWQETVVAHGDLIANEGFGFAVHGFGFLMYPLAELNVC